MSSLIEIKELLKTEKETKKDGLGSRHASTTTCEENMNGVTSLHIHDVCTRKRTIQL